MADQDYVIVTEEHLRAAAVPLFVAAGVPEPDAELFVDVHIDSDLRGDSSHGARMFDTHLNRIKAGTILTKPKITVLQDRQAVALFDAHHSMGQVVAVRAMRLAVHKARNFGVGVVGVRNANSYTSGKYYPLLAAAEGMIGISYINGRPMMPPHGGLSRKLGNSPLSFAAPAGEEFPLVLDMGCTISEQVLREANEQGRAIPTDWALGRDGRPTSDPAEALEAFTFLPFGGYKASGMSAMHEILTSVLCGGDLFTKPGSGYHPFDNLYRCSQFFEAINIEWFMPLAEFRTRVDTLIREIRDTPLRPGFDAVYLPGERGFREMERRKRLGIPLHKDTVANMKRWAVQLGTPEIRVS